MQKPNLTADEAVAWGLRGLFESRGFRRTTPGKFEDYNLYMENRNFLNCEHVVTFMDMDGRLMALKPDVTLSVVKHTRADKQNLYDAIHIAAIWLERALDEK